MNKTIVRVNSEGYYSGIGELRAIDKEKVCVYFSGKGCKWFDENEINYINGGV